MKRIEDKPAYAVMVAVVYVAMAYMLLVGLLATAAAAALVLPVWLGVSLASSAMRWLSSE